MRLLHLRRPWAAALAVLLALVAEASRRRLAASRTRDRARARATAGLLRDLQQAHRMRDEFLSTLSHELRTPLNALLGWAQLLRLRGDDPVLRLHAVGVIERQARAQAQIVSDLLDLAHLVTGRVRLSLHPVDLARVAGEVCADLGDTAHARGVRLALRAPPAFVLGDAARLRQVAWNLVANAIKFTPPGGTVSVAVVGGLRWTELVVSDSGVGIAPELLPLLFERFTLGDSSLTRRAGGLGLGLALVRHLAELHGGSVHAASAGIGRGAQFAVRLPCAALN